MYPLYSPSLVGRWPLVGLWIPHGNHRSIYALQPEGQAVFWFFFFLCVDSKQLSEASLHRPWSPTSQGAISVAGTWPLLSETWLWDCDLPPPAPSVQSVHAWRAEVDVEAEGRWSVFLWNCCRSGRKIVLFVYMFKKNDVSVYLQQTGFY